ncbi:MAG: hypothetical protein ABIN48_03625, partial [Ginsengibacter sp.]
MSLSYKKIKPLIITGDNRFSKLLGFFGLGIGVILLLMSVQMFINIQRVLYSETPGKTGDDFISISKSITNQNMGMENTFTSEDLKELRQQPNIDAISPLISNQYQVTANAGNMLPFSTDLFLESMDPSFLDTLPPNFSWEPGQETIPLIFSTDFLELYNVFAPAQGLPQISPETITSVNIFLECSGRNGRQTFKGNVVALSDRVNSILVPESFMKWSNEYFTGKTISPEPSRVFIKTKDANNPQLISFFDREGYHLNKEKIRFGRLKSTLQNIVGALGVFGILVILMALMLFSFYVQLMIAKSKDNLRLLITLGYSPNWLKSRVARTWLPMYFITVFISLLITQITHLIFRQFPFAQISKL